MATRDVDKFMDWDPVHKQYRPKAWRRDVLPAWLYFDATSQVGIKTVNAAAGAPTPLVVYKQPYTSVNGQDAGLGTPFEVRSLLFQDSTDGTAAANFTVLLQEMGEVRNFMNRPVHIRTFAGSSQNPAILGEPYLFLSQHNIMCTLAKVVGAATTMRLFLHGAQYYPWSPNFIMQPQAKAEMTGILSKWLKRRPYIWPYWLTTDQDVSLAAAVGATATAFAKIGDSAHFEIFGHQVVSAQPAGAANFTYSISEVKTKQTLSNGTPSFASGCGNSFFPTRYSSPYMVPAGSRLKIDFTNLTAQVTSVHFTFYGRLIGVPFKNIREVDQDTMISPVPTPADTPTLMEPKPAGAS